MTDTIERLRQMASYSDFPECCNWDQECMAEAADEIERLRAIVERLPKTADKMPMVPSLDVVWWSHPVINPTVHARRILWSDRYGRWILQGCPEFKPSDGYSTKEAAEKARAT